MLLRSSNSDATILSASRLESPLALTCCAVSVSHQSRFAKPGFASASDVYSAARLGPKKLAGAESARPACSEAAVAAGLRRRPRGQQGAVAAASIVSDAATKPHQSPFVQPVDPCAAPAQSVLVT